MVKNIILVLFSLIVGLAAVLGAYLVATGQTIRIVSPIAANKFSVDNPPKQSITGQITALSGNVLWQGRTAVYPVSISTPQKIQQGENIQTGTNGKATIEFADIATIDQSKNTTINIIQTLPANLVLEQAEGSASYKGLSPTTPVSVVGLDLMVAFNVADVDIKVDKDNSTVSVGVTKGAANIAYTDNENKSYVTLLRTGASIVFNNNTKTVQ